MPSIWSSSSRSSSSDRANWVIPGLDTRFNDGEFNKGGSSSTSSMVGARSEEHTSELHSLIRISYAVCGLKKKSISRDKLCRVNIYTHCNTAQLYCRLLLA